MTAGAFNGSPLRHLKMRAREGVPIYLRVYFAEKNSAADCPSSDGSPMVKVVPCRAHRPNAPRHPLPSQCEAHLSPLAAASQALALSWRPDCGDLRRNGCAYWLISAYWL